MSEDMIGITHDYVDDNFVPEGFGVVHSQELPDHYWEGLQWARSEQTKATRCKNFHKVADIPAVFVEMWMRRDNFDVMKAPLKDIIKKLHSEHLTDFITTEKRVI
jgi:hypothetical protein